MDKNELAKIGYEAYRAHTGGISLVSKQPIPPYDNLSEAIKEAWMAAAIAVAAHVGFRLGKTVQDAIGLSQNRIMGDYKFVSDIKAADAVNESKKDEEGNK